MEEESVGEVIGLEEIIATEIGVYGEGIARGGGFSEGADKGVGGEDVGVYDVVEYCEGVVRWEGGG